MTHEVAVALLVAIARDSNAAESWSESLSHSTPRPGFRWFPLWRTDHSHGQWSKILQSMLCKTRKKSVNQSPPGVL